MTSVFPTRGAQPSACDVSTLCGDGELPSIDRAIAAYLRNRAMKGSTAQTLADLARYLQNFRDWAQLQGIRELAGVDDKLLRQYQRFVFEYRKQDGTPLATASKLAKLVPLRGWLRWLAARCYVSGTLVEVIELPVADQALPRVLLSAADIEKVASLAPLDLPRGLRDRAILELLYATGIRRMELAQLEVADLDLTRGILRVRHGKGRKDRRLPIAARTMHWLLAYLERGRPVLPGAESLMLFPVRRGLPLSLSWLSTLVSGYVRRSGLQHAGSCHLFRHSMATLMLDGGADIRYIQVMLGHAQLSTTQIYTQVSMARLEQVYLTTHPGARGACQRE